MDKKLNVYPGLNKLLVKELELPDTGSILSTAMNVLRYAEIVAVGAIKDRDNIDDTMFNVGDNVYALTQAGIEIELPEGTFRLINITDVLVGVRTNG